MALFWPGINGPKFPATSQKIELQSGLKINQLEEGSCVESKCSGRDKFIQLPEMVKIVSWSPFDAKIMN